MHKLEFSFSLWKIYSTSDWKQFLKASDALALIFKKYIDEAEQNLRKHDDSDKELSAFEKMLQIDKDIAMTMTMDMLQAGIDTVVFNLKIRQVLIWFNLDRENSWCHIVFPGEA